MITKLHSHHKIALNSNFGKPQIPLNDNGSQNHKSTDPKNKKFKFPFDLIIKVLILLGVIIASAGYYFIFFKEEKFPLAFSNVSASDLQQQDFQQVAVYGGNVSFFVPNKWLLTDKDLMQYTDILNASSAYANVIPNNLGDPDRVICQDLQVAFFDEVKVVQIYKDVKLNSYSKTQKGDWNGCYGELSMKVEDKDYSMRSFFVLREDFIVHLVLTYRTEFTHEAELSQKILESLVIKL